MSSSLSRTLSGLLLGMAVAGVTLSGCSGTPKATDGEVALKLRSMQTRAYDTTDVNKAVRTAMATLQDLGFVIDDADPELGSVTASKLDKYVIKMTVTVRPRGNTQLLVRANAQYNVTPVEDANFYQQFFAAYSKAMFLEAQQVDPAAPGA
jgi:hypothetical protein